MDLDILVNLIPISWAVMYRLSDHVTNTTKANWMIALAASPLLIPEIQQFAWLNDTLVWCGTLVLLLIAKIIVWRAAPKLVEVVSIEWMGIWQWRLLGSLILWALVKENLY